MLLFQKDIDQRFDQYLHHNEKASKKKCQDLLTSLFAKMADQLQEGFYAKPGGYKVLCKDMDSIVKEYNSQTTKLVKVTSGIQRLVNKYFNHHHHHHYFVCVIPS